LRLFTYKKDIVLGVKREVISIEKSPYNPEFVAKIKRSETQVCFCCELDNLQVRNVAWNPDRETQFENESGNRILLK